MNTIIESNKSILNSICKSYNIGELYAFGSVCTTSFNEQSDIDLIASFNEKDVLKISDLYFNFKWELEKTFNRKVDLLTPAMLTNPYFINVVNKTKTKIYG